MDNDILILNNYLFLKQTGRAQEQYAYFRREKKLSKVAISSFEENIKHNNSYCSARNIPYSHIVFPAKIVGLSNLFKSKDIDIFPLFTDKHKHENVYYPLHLIEALSHYSKTDTHINDKGCSRLFNYLLEMSGMETATPYFEKTKQHGDLGKILGLEPEKIEKISNYNELIPYVKHYAISPALSGNTGDFDYYLNLNYISEKRLLLFGDSFFKNSIEVYSYFFKEVIYVRNPFIIDDMANILAPDIIFSGNAERYLVTPPNVHCYRPFFANFISGNFNSEKLTHATKVAFHYLLQGRESPQFKDWLFKKRLTIPQKKLTPSNLNKITELDILTDNDVDFCRDTAVKFETVNLELSIKLMKIAGRKRPDGVFIREKLKEYSLRRNFNPEFR